MSYTLLTTIYTKPSFSTFCYTEKKKHNFFQNNALTTCLYIIETIPNNRTRIFELVLNIIWHLTCITIHSNPSRFTCETCSILYVTLAVFTACRTMIVTFTAVYTSIITSCIKVIIIHNFKKMTSD